MKICMGCMGQYKDEYTICPHCGFYEGTRAEEAMHMDPGSILCDRYIIGKVVGFGGFGVTYIGWDAKLERRIAVKEYLPGEFSTRIPGHTQITVFSDATKIDQFNTGMKKFIDEARNLVQFQNEDGIVKVYDTFEDNNTAYIIMEFLEGETLTEYLKREEIVPVDKAIAMLLPIVRSLKAVHDHGIIHRDIAPDNIHIGTNGKIKLIDFGAARYATTNHSRSLTVIIKPGYSPEEQYRSRGDQGPHTDGYAIGAVLYRMVTGKTPPDAMERRAMFEKHGKDMLIPLEKLAKDIPENRAIAITNALNVRIENRTPDMNALEHELTTDEPVARREGKIKRIDILKAPLPVKIGIGAAAAAIITLSILFVTGVIGFDALLKTTMNIPEGMARVPSIVNNELAEAEERVGEFSLLFAIVGKEFSTNVPADRVLTQDLTAGSLVPVNSLLSIVISAGFETKVVDEFSGEDVDTVRLALEQKGFSVKIVQEYSMEYAPGTVIEQDTEAGAELAVGETITLRVSMGRNPAEPFQPVAASVPDITKMSYGEAKDALVKKGFLFKITRREYSDEIPDSQVISQSLPAGTGAMTGDVIEVVVSKGPFTAYMPDVQYKHLDEAKYLLQEQQLAYTVTYQESETIQAEHVISQSIEPKTKLSAGTSVALVVSQGGKPVQVPDAAVGNPKLADARNLLVTAGFSVSVSYERSETVAEGRVIRQNISPGTMAARGETVTLIVSSGKEKLTAVVPNVSGMAQADARAALEAAGFRISVNEIENETVALGYVISQNPAGGSEQMKGATIYLAVSKGEPAVIVPDVKGQSQSMAEKMLRDAKLTPAAVTEFSKAEDKDKVIAQTPKAGASLKRGDVVTITVSLGVKTNQMPNVVGQVQSTAESSISALNLNLSISWAQEYSDTIPEGSIMSQDPWAGAVVNDGATVKLVVSRGGNPISIPNVVGAAESAARDQLNVQGLRVGTVTQEYSETTELGRIISQSPAAGTQAKKGDAVNLVVSKGAELLTVPSLAGYQFADAKSKNSDFNIVEKSQEYSDTVASGFIISQNPAAGSKAAKGATIDVVVSKGKEPVVVPDVLGKTQSQAESELRSKHFAVSVENGTSMTVAKGSVISQVPAGGVTAPKGETVRIIVCIGKPQVTVPDVSNKSRESARNAIESALLAAELKTANHDTIPEGQVISQVPAGGTTVDQGSTVSVTVSAGRAEFAVPDVVKQTWAAAKATLEGDPYYFKTSRRDEHHDTIVSGSVISISPAAGSKTQKGATIEVTVSLGKKPIPDVYGYSEDNAKRTLTDAGFTPSVTYEDTKQYNDNLVSGDEISKGNVLRQSSVGTDYSSTTVTIYIPRVLSLGKAPFPAYAGSSSATVAQDVGTFYFNVKQQFHDHIGSGQTISQEPAAGNTEWSSRTAEVTVSKGKEPFPAYSGSSTAVGEGGGTFSFSVTSQYNASVPAGTVISQTPSAGSTSWSSRMANVIVSDGPEPAVITSVSVSPDNVTVDAGGSVTFGASVSGTGPYSTSVTWSVNSGGSYFSGNTLYVGENESGTLTVTATSADGTKSGTAYVNVTPKYIPPENPENTD